MRDRRREAVERFTKEFAPLITSGPPGLAGYATRPQRRCGRCLPIGRRLVPKELVPARVEVRSGARVGRVRKLESRELISVADPTACHGTTTITLGEIAHARSGDKGNHANVGVIAYTQAGYEFLREQLTTERVGRVFRARWRRHGVERFELPRACAPSISCCTMPWAAGPASRCASTRKANCWAPRSWNWSCRGRPTSQAMRRTPDLATRQPSSPSDSPSALPQAMEPLVKIQVHEHTATVTLNRPDKRNALSRGLLQGLHQALDDLHQERRVRGVILTGAGTVFCAGMDLVGNAGSTNEQEDRLAQWQADSVVYHDLIEAMLRFPKPLVAAVNGPAVAGGAGLVMACDLVVASDSATFGFPEPRRGIVAGMVAPLLGVSHRRQRRPPICCSPRELIDADEAHRYGLFHELVADDKIWARAHRAGRRDRTLGARGGANDQAAA